MKKIKYNLANKLEKTYSKEILINKDFKTAKKKYYFKLILFFFQ